MKVEVLLPILLKMASFEYPNIETESDKYAKQVEGIRSMTNLYVEVGGRGDIVSPDVDPLLLAVIGYEESRHGPLVQDGDCTKLPSGTQCSAFGPMQLAKSSPSMLKNIDPKWAGITVQKLRDPRVNVEAAYTILRYWKTECKGGPDTWLGSYMAGKCLRSIPQGRKRCTLTHALGKATGVEIPACTVNGTDPRTLRLTRFIEGQ